MSDWQEYNERIREAREREVKFNAPQVQVTPDPWDAPDLIEVKTVQPQASIGDLLEAFDRLGPNAQRLLLAIARRLVLGHERYGDFPIRAWTQEAKEEALDCCVYLAAELMGDDDK